MQPYTRALFNAAVLAHDTDAMAVADWLMAVVIRGESLSKTLTADQAHVACLIASKEIAGRITQWVIEWNTAEAEAFG